MPGLTHEDWGGKEEVRTTNEKTGGQKGTKIEEFALIPVEPLRQLAEMYGRGAQKYASRNWERGYEWSKSYSALQRHANAFWGGEDFIPQTPDGEDDDPTAGVHHLIAVAWHALAMVEWATTHPELDDRVKPEPTVLVLGLQVPVGWYEARKDWPLAALANAVKEEFL